MSAPRFAGAIPEIYDRYLVPLIFAAFAEDLAGRVAAWHAGRNGGGATGRVLEMACGTGAVTRELARGLPAGVEIVATDLNPPMLERAAARGTSRPVTWRQADAMALPFPDGAFDAVVCQFGVMFFPDRPTAFAEARRVLRPGGRFFFNTWDCIETSEFAYVVCEAIKELFPADPPDFPARGPHGYHDPAAISRDVAAGGFPELARIEPLQFTSRAASPEIAAMALCQGTPLRNDIEARDPDGLPRATAHAAAALARRFGTGPIAGEMRAYVVSVERG